MSAGGLEAKSLEGRQEGENAAPRSRDFFWDSVVLFTVAAIFALTVIDVVAEYIRGSVVECFLPGDVTGLDSVSNYVNQVCGRSLPLAAYLPAAITIHAFLILAPHYLWLNVFGAKLDFFFQHTYQLVRTRDEKTGEYARANYVISQQLEEAFNRSNWMYYGYLLKLALQIVTAAVGLVLVVIYLDDFTETFSCSGSEFESDFWPLGEEQNVSCVFTSLRLLGQVRYFYFGFLGLALLLLCVSIIWLVTAHPSVLGVQRVAQFSFQSGLPVSHFRPQPPLSLLPSGLGNFAHGLLSSLLRVTIFGAYTIGSDYDFLMIKLSRTDGGLSHVLREIHALRLLKKQNDLEYARVSIYKRKIARDEGRDKASSQFLMANLRWVLPDSDQYHKQTSWDTPLPLSVRGVVLGFAARVLGSVEHDNQEDDEEDEGAGVGVMKRDNVVKRSLSGALCVGFDSESIGVAGALARVFTRVGTINFSPYFTDYINTVVDCSDPTVRTHITLVTCPEDMLVSGKISQSRERDEIEEKLEVMNIVDPQLKFLRDIEEIWKPGIISAELRDALEKKEWNEEMNKWKEENVKWNKDEKKWIEMNPGSKPPPFEYTAANIDTLESDYIVIGPLTSDLQVATVNYLLEAKQGNISDTCLLLTIRPLRIAGRNVEKEEFLEYQPPAFFPKRVSHRLDLRHTGNVIPQWPPSNTASTSDTATEAAKYFDLALKAGDTDYKLRFTLYQYDEESNLSETESNECDVRVSCCGASRRSNQERLTEEVPLSPI